MIDASEELRLSNTDNASPARPQSSGTRSGRQHRGRALWRRWTGAVSLGGATGLRVGQAADLISLESDHPA
jgi:hypothetical protein